MGSFTEQDEDLTPDQRQERLECRFVVELGGVAALAAPEEPAHGSPSSSSRRAVFCPSFLGFTRWALLSRRDDRRGYELRLHSAPVWQSKRRKDRLDGNRARSTRRRSVAQKSPVTRTRVEIAAAAATVLRRNRNREVVRRR